MAAKAQSLYDKGTLASRRALLTSADDHKGIGSHLPLHHPLWTPCFARSKDAHRAACRSSQAMSWRRTQERTGHLPT